MKEVIKSLVGEIIEVYSLPDATSFDAGRLVAENGDLLLLHQLRRQGGFDGYLVMMVSDVSLVCTRTKYLELRCAEHNIDTSNDFKLRESFREILVDGKGKVVTAGIEQDFRTGRVLEVAESTCRMAAVTEDGHFDGEMFLRIEDIRSLLLDTEVLRILASKS